MCKGTRISAPSRAQNGQSLVQVMIAAGIAASTALLIAQTQIYQGRTAKGIEQRGDVSEFKNILGMTYGNAKNGCANNVKQSAIRLSTNALDENGKPVKVADLSSLPLIQSKEDSTAGPEVFKFSPKDPNAPAGVIARYNSLNVDKFSFEVPRDPATGKILPSAVLEAWPSGNPKRVAGNLSYVFDRRGVSTKNRTPASGSQRIVDTIPSQLTLADAPANPLITDCSVAVSAGGGGGGGSIDEQALCENTFKGTWDATANPKCALPSGPPAAECANLGGSWDGTKCGFGTPVDPFYWIGITDRSPSAYQSAFDAAMMSKLNLRNVATYTNQSTGQTVVAASFYNRYPRNFASYTGMSGAVYQSRFDTMMAAGYRPIQLNCNSKNNGNSADNEWSAIWELNQPNRSFAGRHGVDWGAIVAENTTRVGQGMIMTWITTCGDGKYGALWQQNTDGWQAAKFFRSASSPQYQTDFTNAMSGGYLPKSLGTERNEYVGLFWKYKNTPNWWFGRHLVEHAYSGNPNYEGEFQTYIAQGRVLVFFDGGGTAGGANMTTSFWVDKSDADNPVLMREIGW